MSETTYSSFSPLQQWSKKVLPPYPKLLAWCHTMDAYALRSIIKSGKIEPRHCDVFNENIVYFFYGRPAFRRGDSETIGQFARAPIVILLNPDLINQGARLFPFDTGAFSDKRYAKWMHREMIVNDFELGCENIAPLRHVRAFFGKNQSYLDLSCIVPEISYHGEFEVESMMKLLMDQDSNTADDRRLAMELQVKNSIAFDASSVVALIIPDELENADWFNSFIKGPGKGIDVQYYQMTLHRQAIQYQNTLELKATEIQKNMDLI